MERDLNELFGRQSRLGETKNESRQISDFEIEESVRRLRGLGSDDHEHRRVFHHLYVTHGKEPDRFVLSGRMSGSGIENRFRHRQLSHDGIRFRQLTH